MSIKLYRCFPSPLPLYIQWHVFDTGVLDRIKTSKVKDVDSSDNYFHTKFNKICKTWLYEFKHSSWMDSVSFLISDMEHRLKMNSITKCSY
jgi:hypothetical protein